MDIFPQHLEHGYWGDLTRTVVRGKAPARLRRMYQAVRAAQAAALAAIRPGVKCATVHERAAAEMKRRGFATVMEGAEASGFIHGTGHGVGLSIHEEPALADGVDGRLRAGHVVTVEPGLYYPGFGGVRIEDTVVVTPGGWRYLAPCEKRLEV
jgi:Xaa-Pro aminopeptidase